MLSATQQLRVADSLAQLWAGLLPDYEAPSRTQFLTWADMVPEATAAYALNRAAHKIRKESMTAERLGRYITGIMRNEREGRHIFTATDSGHPHRATLKSNTATPGEQ